MIRIRNAGHSDHRILWGLSDSLVSSIYSGTEHSTIYAEDAVYTLAIRNILNETPSRLRDLTTSHSPLPSAPNPYLLPWDLHTLLSCPDFRDKHPSLRGELASLQEEFDSWSPAGVHDTEEIKKLKSRLAGFSAKL